MILLDNVNSFKDIESILKVEHELGYWESFVGVKLNETISNPNIVLGRARDIGKVASNHDFDLSEFPPNAEELSYILECVGAVAKLDELGSNLTDNTKFKLLNYLIDNTENIKNLDSSEEIFSYMYILNCLFEAFMNSKSGTFAYLQGIDIVLENRLYRIIYEDVEPIMDSLFDGGCRWIDEGLEKMKTYE